MGLHANAAHVAAPVPGGGFTGVPEAGTVGHAETFRLIQTAKEAG
jgi:hypothetical protein